MTKHLSFDLGETVEMLRNSVRHFVDKEIAPHAADIDIENKFPNELWKKLGRMGMLGITIGVILCVAGTKKFAK